MTFSFLKKESVFPWGQEWGYFDQIPDWNGIDRMPAQWMGPKYSIVGKWGEMFDIESGNKGR